MFEICSGLGRSQHSKFRLNKKIKKFRGKILIFFFEKTLGLGGLLDMLFAHLLHNNCTTMLICLAFFYKKKKKKKIKNAGHISIIVQNYCAANISFYVYVQFM
jgi:Na+/melibiose symporter-like transporter